MNDIFKNAKFGDKFTTNDGRMSVLISIPKENETLTFCTISLCGEPITYNVNPSNGILRENGKDFVYYPSALNIIGKLEDNKCISDCPNCVHDCYIRKEPCKI